MDLPKGATKAGWLVPRSMAQIFQTFEILKNAETLFNVIKVVRVNLCSLLKDTLEIITQWLKKFAF